MDSLPQLGTPLDDQHLKFLKAFSTSCRHSAIAMLKNSQSGHPGGSLSCMDYLTLLYTSIIGQTGEVVVVSNGHISPGVYATLAEMGYIPKQEVIETFRKAGSMFEGHVARHVDGVWYGTGPLGIGASAGEGFALAEKLNQSGKNVYILIGDGEAQEGQVYETIHSAAKYKLDNLIAFIDYNEVQLTASLEEIMPIDIVETFKAGKWHVIEVDGHDYQAMWAALDEAQKVEGKPVAIVGRTIMGKGVDFMEDAGKAHKADWHGKAPKPEQADEALAQLEISEEEKALLEAFRSEHVKWKPEQSEFPNLLTKDDIDMGTPMISEPGTVTDCRSAYGKALLDLAKRNSNILALCADLRGSVKTDGVAKEFPERHIEVGIAEQNMVSLAGGLSLSNFIPFASTFGAFMSSRAKDQARVNDINHTNVKMVATHCGLSVGEDGPTHQAIDDMGSFLGMFNTMIIEPADANQTDHIIRYVAAHHGNFYVRMGRHKFPVLLKEDGSVFYDENYEYRYGRTDVVRPGDDVTIIATGACVGEAVAAREKLAESGSKLSVEIVAVSSIKEFDSSLVDSIKKTKKIITVEDHNTYSGLGSQIGRFIADEELPVEVFTMLGVEEYQLSGTSQELYEKAGISAEHIHNACLQISN